jgi:flagellar assembly factor FliW
MPTITIDSTRFGPLEIASEDVIEFPAGLIGLGGTRFTLVSTEPEGAFRWLHSVEDPTLALPVTDPSQFFADYVVELSDEDRARFDAETAEIWVTVRAGSELSDFSANLRAPILVVNGCGHQVINELAHPVRAPLFTTVTAQAA